MRRGHYRLTGLPKGPAYRLFLNPGNGSPYTKTTFRVPAETPALDPVKFDVALKRGVLVRGRVTDKATGKPVSGYVNAYTFGDNPHVEELSRLRSSYAPFVYLDDDGRYEIVDLARTRHHCLSFRPGSVPRLRRRRRIQGI